MENYRHYQTKGLINKDQLTNQVALYYQQHNNLLSLSGQNEQNALQITALESRIQNPGRRIRQPNLPDGVAALRVAKELLNIDAGGAIVIRALADGRVDSLSVTVGQMVNIGDSLLQLLPKISNTMLWCFGCPTTPSLTLPPEIRSMCAMTPFRRKNLASSPAPCPSSPKPRPHRRKCGPIRGPKAALTAAVPYYKVIVMPEKQAIAYDGKRLSLENGMTAQKYFVSGKRTIYQWMLSPFYDMKHSATGPVDE